jgi:hypothetical protein
VTKNESRPEVEEVLLAELYFRREDLATRLANLQTKISVLAALATTLIVLVLSDKPEGYQGLMLGLTASLAISIICLIPWLSKEDRITHLRSELNEIPASKVIAEFIDFQDTKLSGLKRQLSCVAWGFTLSFLILSWTFIVLISNILGR